MGMYDSIIIEKLICPYCKKKANIYFQTKEGYCVLGSFRMGDIFPLSRKPYSTSKKSKTTWISGLASCPNCHTFNRKTLESIYTWLEGSFLIDDKTHRIIQFELWRFMRDIPRTQRQRRDFDLTKKVKVFNPSQRK
jgi:hypothetical protein